ncbi:hypothetical protein E3Q17_01537 [Wallemia mellicola]|uniref:Mitochondrial carrier n=1 Tax=Wallemia mellicola TaxID=1708541 RepID=A0A4T0NZL9_9BASI|nr:hypothetical protein E3Q19_00317 [Wallemia mellicola]TIC02169.1 hypothetical protein E3Q17_01537 [Wallemia mellicola]TIC73133.1 hypothetical protein E3Q00_03247 [Wallemia mellicola]
MTSSEVVAGSSAGATMETKLINDTKRPSPWRHLVAGGLGGMTGAIITSPFDVVKTRLQSDIYHKSIAAKHNQSNIKGLRGTLYHFVETVHMMRDIYVKESPRALFRGLGPTLFGVIPARSINFFTYGNLKSIIAGKSREDWSTHLLAAACAGIVTATATNPIWVIKTRLQLSPELSVSSKSAKVSASRKVIGDLIKNEGIRGLYRGLSASYLGVTESTLQWILYEQLKDFTKDSKLSSMSTMVSAGLAKSTATVITYPHEVIRTRMRQAVPVGEKPRYTSLIHTLKLVLAEEGVSALYGGLSAHLMRVVPNAAAMFLIYEFVTYRL